MSLREQSVTLPAGASLFCAYAFGAAALAGLVFALTGPVALVRVLGLAALAAGALGLAMHVYLLRREHPASWITWRNDLRAFAERERRRPVAATSRSGRLTLVPTGS